VIKISHILVC